MSRKPKLSGALERFASEPPAPPPGAAVQPPGPTEEGPLRGVRKGTPDGRIATTLRLTRGEHQALGRLALEQNRRAHDVLRDALRQYLARHGETPGRY